MRKKIGIITFHEPISYGATMQCLGLQEYLRDIGYDSRVIDYSMTAYVEERNKHKIKTVLNRIRKLLANPIKYISILMNSRLNKNFENEYRSEIEVRNDKFRSFRLKHYFLSEKRYETKSALKNTPPRYDAYICGSDQIWNPNFCDFDCNYFLDFAERNKRIAYAPSFGVSIFPKNKEEELIKRIQEFDCLSIREKSGAEIIKKICGREAQVVIDPTFLLDVSKWEDYANESNCDIQDKFILTYFIGYDKYIENAQKEIKSRYKGSKVVDLVFDRTSYGPADFLYLIKNAEYIVTNSFHGCAFCIIFRKQFSVVKSRKDFIPGNAFSRIDSLLRLFGIEKVIIDDKYDFESYKIDYLKVDILKKAIVEESREYLDKSIKTVLCK